MKALATIIASLCICFSAHADNYDLKGPFVGTTVAKSVRSYYDILKHEHVATMDELANKKGISTTESQLMLARIFMGLVDTAVSESGEKKPYFCIPKNVTSDQLLRAVGDFVIEAKNLTKAEGSVVVVAALSELYPCLTDDSASQIP